MPAEVEAILDDYVGAIEAGDADAWLQTITEDWFLRQYAYGQNRQELYVDLFTEEEDTPNYRVRRLNFYPSNSVERSSDRVVTGEGPWFVSEHQTWTEHDEQGANFVFDGNASLVVVERDGELLVASEVWVGTVSIEDS